MDYGDETPKSIVSKLYCVIEMKVINARTNLK